LRNNERKEAFEKQWRPRRGLNEMKELKRRFEIIEEKRPMRKN
jgi:hypothetical protein